MTAEDTVDSLKVRGVFDSSVSVPFSLNPDPVKNRNPVPDPRYFLTLSGKKLKLPVLHDFKIFSVEK